MSNWHGLRRISLASTLTVLSLLIFLSIVVGWLLVSTQGAKAMLQLWQQKTILPFDMVVGQWEGSIIKGLTLKDIELKRISYLPADAYIRIQEVTIILKGPSTESLDVDIKNARLLLKNSDPLVLQAKINSGKVNANVYARSLDVGLAAALLPIEANTTYLSGFVSNVDVNVRGDIKHLNAMGRLFVDHIKYKTTVVSQGPGEFNLTADLSRGFKNMTLEGSASMSEGIVEARRVTMDLTTSKVYFKGEGFNPQLDVHATSIINQITIDLGFKGTLRKPELVIVSDPPLPADVLLVMVATGKAWGKPSTITPKNNTVSAELVSDFFDYLVMGGKGGDFARQYGLTDFKMQYDDQSKRIGLKKKLSEDFRVGVELEQVPAGLRSEQTTYSKKVEGELDVTDHLSLNVSQKVLPEDNTHDHLSPNSNPVDKSKDETQIYLKYQSRF